jgi:multifunctional methyltransferase subunit TRM112
MKVITANFVTCAVKECKTSAASFPLHFHDAELEQQELDFQPEFIRNVLPRVDWDSLRITANEVGQHRSTPHITSPNWKREKKRSVRRNIS